MNSVYENIILTLFRTLQHPCPLIADDPSLLMASEMLKAQTMPDFFFAFYLTRFITNKCSFSNGPQMNHCIYLHVTVLNVTNDGELKQRKFGGQPQCR